MMIQWGLVKAVWRRVPALRIPKNATRSQPMNEGSAEGDVAEPSVIDEVTGNQSSTVNPPPISQKTTILTRLKSLLNTYKTFTHHPVFLPTLSISQLYLTVLSFGPVMISYLLLRGYSSILISIMRAIGVLSGLTATIATPKLVSHIGLVRTGLWCLWSEVACLVVVLGSFWMSGVVAAVMVFGGTCGSRFGLWGFDLVQMQIMQERLV